MSANFPTYKFTTREERERGKRRKISHTFKIFIRYIPRKNRIYGCASFCRSYEEIMVPFSESPSLFSWLQFYLAIFFAAAIGSETD